MAHLNCHPFSPIFSHFSLFLPIFFLHVLCYRWMLDYDDGESPDVVYCYKLSPNRVKAECLCLQKAVTIFQHTHATADCAWLWQPITKDMKTLVTPALQGVSSLPPWLGFIVRALHAVHTQCPRSALAPTWPRQALVSAYTRNLLCLIWDTPHSGARPVTQMYADVCR